MPAIKMKKRLKINGIIIFLVVMAIIFFPDLFLRRPNDNYYEAYIKIFGIAFIIFGQILRASGRGYKSEHSQSGHSLTQGGPYAMVRNPMYLGIFLMGLGMLLTLFNIWTILIFLAIFIWRYIFLIFQEEKKLLAAFPSFYPDYMRKTPRILPSFALILRKDIAGYVPLKVRWLKKEAGPVSVTLFLIFLIDGWQNVRSAGIKMYMKDAVLFVTTIILFALFILYLISRTDSHQKDAANKK